MCTVRWKTSLPLRWMAPETLESFSESKTVTYSNKTDAWTFGITLWEMYSRGKLSHGILCTRTP